MLANRLAAAVNTRYPAASISPGSLNEPIATIPAIHVAVGAVTIWVEDTEVRIEVGAHTHGHFATYDDPSPESTEARTVDTVLEFLDALFSNQVVVWSAGGSGGWYWLGLPPITGFAIPKGARRFLWSGPLSS